MSAPENARCPPGTHLLPPSGQSRPRLLLGTHRVYLNPSRAAAGPNGTPSKNANRKDRPQPDDPIPLVEPVVLEPDRTASTRLSPYSAQDPASRTQPHQHQEYQGQTELRQAADAPRNQPGPTEEEGHRIPSGLRTSDGPAASTSQRASLHGDLPAPWTGALHLIAAAWGLTWLVTAGCVAAGYCTLAAASSIAAAAFCCLAPGAAASASAAAAAATAAAVAGTGAVAASPAASAAAVAAVDWLDVALRTAAGLASGGPSREQVLLTLQDAGAGSAASWAVQWLLPGLCALSSGCRSASLAMQSGAPCVGFLAQLTSAAAGLLVLLVMAAPLRPYLAPLLPFLPAARLSPSTLTALRAGGVICMVTVLTGLQAIDLSAPSLAPTVRGAAAAAAAVSPLLLQHQALLYGLAAVASDVVVPACTAAVSGWIAWRLLSGTPGEGPVRAEAEEEEGAGAQADGDGGGLPRTVLGAVRAVAAGRLLLDGLLLAAVVAGQLVGKVSAVKLLGMLWLLQTAQQL